MVCASRIQQSIKRFDHCRERSGGLSLRNRWHMNNVNRERKNWESLNLDDGETRSLDNKKTWRNYKIKIIICGVLKFALVGTRTTKSEKPTGKEVENSEKKVDERKLKRVWGKLRETRDIERENKIK
jgi:hypothetical protein